jgi:hypothetical protein
MALRRDPRLLRLGANAEAFHKRVCELFLSTLVSASVLLEGR